MICIIVTMRGFTVQRDSNLIELSWEFLVMGKSCPYKLPSCIQPHDPYTTPPSTRPRTQPPDRQPAYPTYKTADGEAITHIASHFGYLASDFTTSAHFGIRCRLSRFSPMWPPRISPRILRRTWRKWSKMFLESHQTRWEILTIIVFILSPKDQYLWKKNQNRYFIHMFYNIASYT